MTNTQAIAHHMEVSSGSRIPFLLAFIQVFTVCFNHLHSSLGWAENAVWFILQYGVIWAGCILMLLVFPRGLSLNQSRVLITGCAVLLRLALLFPKPWDGLDLPQSLMVSGPAITSLWIIMVDAGSILILQSILCHRRLNIRWAVLYAMNPIVMISVVGGNFETVFIFFLLGAICLYDHSRWFWMYLVCRLGCVLALHGVFGDAVFYTDR